MSKFYRCGNPDCPTSPDFEADVPVCPDCKADGRIHAGLLVELTPVHYFVKDPTGPIRTQIGNRSIACAPTRTKLFKSMTGERSAVTCSKCKASAVFVAHEAGGEDQHEAVLEKKLATENRFKGVTQG